MSILKKVLSGILFIVLSIVSGGIIITINSFLLRGVIKIFNLSSTFNGDSISGMNNIAYIIAIGEILSILILCFIMSKYIFKIKRFLTPVFFLTGFCLCYFLALNYGVRGNSLSSPESIMLFYGGNFVISLIYYILECLIRKLRKKISVERAV